MNAPIKSSLQHFNPHVTSVTDGPIRVRATAKGFYNHTLRQPGDEFGIHTADEFAEKWMAYVAADPGAPDRVDDDEDQGSQEPAAKKPSGKPSGQRGGKKADPTDNDVL